MERLSPYRRDLSVCELFDFLGNRWVISNIRLHFYFLGSKSLSSPINLEECKLTPS